MKKSLDKSLVFHGIGVLILLAELLIVNGFLAQLNIFTYLLVIGIIPAIVLFAGSLLHSMFTKASALFTYIAALVIALVFSGIMLIYCSATITPELIDTILNNTITSDTAQVSMTTASAGDNIQSILIFVAFSGIGAFVGNCIRNKKAAAPAKQPVDIASEYDN